MPPLTSARRKALRAMLSAVAGGGLTAAGLGGPLSAPALATTPETPTTTVPAPGAPAPPETGAEQPSTTTSTTTTIPVPAPPSTSTVPAANPTASEAPTSPKSPKAPVVVLQRRQKVTAGRSNESITKTTGGNAAAGGKGGKATGPSNVAPSPQSVAQAGALAAVLASAQSSDEALAFYRIPLFLLPIYKAAAVQYGVPWQILAAINEIETDYGTDQSVSSAGAVGWMQFMPATWLQYGVDALNSGYADPYNPVDAIFAAARYLRAAGAATDLHGAILAYNHSEEYADSVLLRAKLISTYPKAVIATLTGLTDGRLPVSGKQLAWSQLPVETPAPSSATADAQAVSGQSAAPSSSAAVTPGSSAAPSPGAAAAAAAPASPPAAQPMQFVELTSAPNATVVAVQDGRIVKLGASRKLGRYVILRDVYGDLFTYAGLGSIAPTYTLADAPHSPVKSHVIEAASTHDPAPSLPASAGSQSPLTLHVQAPLAPSPQPAAAGAGQASVPQEGPPAGMGKIRLFARPGNPDARAAAAVIAARRAKRNTAGQRVALQKGSIVTSGTVLGRVLVPEGGRDGHLRFAIRPAGDSGTVSAGPILANWAKLQTALHPQGATATNALLGATASDVFLQSDSQLERAVLSDPGITLDACGRHDVASGAVDKRVLAVLAFLSRSGLRPTASVLRCGAEQPASARALSAQNSGAALDITAINNIPIAAHQGPGTITDLTIRTLLTLPAEFIPHEILSLMRYPGAPNTHALPAYSNQIQLAFRPAPAATPLDQAATASAAHSAKSGATAPVPVVTTSPLSAAQWNQLMTRVAALPTPTVKTKPSSQAIPDKSSSSAITPSLKRK
jgi:membrane-bound lytic murein transglycosylase B